MLSFIAGSTTCLSWASRSATFAKDLCANVVLHHHVPRDWRVHDHRVESVGTIHDLPKKESKMNSSVRERMTQIMFETLNVLAMCVAIQVGLSLYAS